MARDAAVDHLGIVEPPPLTVREVYVQVASALRRPLWPADVFAVTASVLSRSGAYTRCIQTWPPKRFADLRQWISHVRRIGRDWREGVAEEGNFVPPQVEVWWDTLQRGLDVALPDLAQDTPLCEALFQLTAAADEACVGLGLSFKATEKDPFREDSETLLLLKKGWGSLCRDIHPSRVRVLPKMHTPQRGMTMRSLTHNLALCEGRGVDLSWHKIPFGTQRGSLNLLVVPWPKVVSPTQFSFAEGDLAMPENHGFFSYSPAELVEDTLEHLLEVFDAAVRTVGRVDGVILPELAVTEPQYVQLREQILSRGAFLLSGYADTRQQFSLNCLAMDFPRPDGTCVSVGPQHKHHRWALDRAQIVQYGLGSVLDHTACHWEHIPLEGRTLSFVALNDRLTLTALICEDLARQDPVSDAVRAVGPNLIVALLMDGPQLNTRWPARYATVLADDPGSSVLTLTSLGMAALSCPRDSSPSRAVALWKDAHTGAPRELELPEHADALALSIVLDAMPEWTADGRDDGGATGFPILAGVFPISRNTPKLSAFASAAVPTAARARTQTPSPS